MKSVIFLVETQNIRGSHPKPFWLAHAIKGHALHGDWIKAATLVGAESPQLDSAALYDGAERAGVIHFLGSYDADGQRVAFCLNDLTYASELVEAVRQFSAENGNILKELRTL